MTAFGRPEYEPLLSALAPLAATGIVPAAAAALRASIEGAGQALREAVVAEIPAFAASGNPDILPGLDRHGREHVEEILRLFAGGAIGDFDFVRVHARLRAEQRFPLEATLHAYRCGHRFLSRWMRDAAIAAGPDSLDKAVTAVADFAIEYTNTISTIATSDYVAHTRLLAEAEGDLRTELLTLLLSGYDESDGRVARLLKRAGYLEQRQSYCVAVAQAANPAEMESLPRAHRLVAALTDALAGSGVRVLAGLRNTLVTAILSDKRRQSGWTAPRADLADRVAPHLLMLGPAVRVGISADHPSTAFMPRALQEATIALDFAGVTRRVAAFAHLPLRDVLVQRGADYVRSASPAWARRLVETDAKTGGVLVATLRAVADADLNIQKAARNLGRHPNTVYQRLERVKDLTGLDGQRFRDLTELLVAADCWRV